jgi:hypothetical protein
MSVVVVGANPAVLLTRNGEVTAFASLWQVDWSERGAGPALVLWHDGRVRLIGPRPELSTWLADTFVRHFGEVSGLPWVPEVEEAGVDLRLSLDDGLTALAGTVTLQISEPLDRRSFHTDHLDLGGTAYRMSNVYVPCGSARLVVDGVPVPGRIALDRAGREPSSSAFLAVAEVWSRRPAGAELVEPEGVNAGSADAEPRLVGTGVRLAVARDVLSGGLPERAGAQSRPVPPAVLLGPPHEDDEPYGADAAGHGLGGDRQ